LLFAAVALALLIVLAKGQVTGPVPVSTGYCAFAAALGLLAAIVGFVAIGVSSLPLIVVGILDFVTFLATLAGGVAYAFFLRNANCSNKYNLSYNNILNCGDAKFQGKEYYMCLGDDDKGSMLMKRCGLAKAGDAFLFMTCVVSAVAIVLTIMARKGKGGIGGRV
jgi:hypothetical protein